MKKVLFFSLVICFVTGNPLRAQSGFLKKVTNPVSNEISGKPEKAIQEPEPVCASDQASLVMDLGGNVQIDYHELSISILSDGRLLAKHNGTEDYYVIKDGVTTGPYKWGDPKIADFVPKSDGDDSDKSIIAKNKPYISKSGEKFLITFGGKKYGPYARIDNFVVSKSKDKFAAMTTETFVVTEDEANKMEEAMNNAKDDQERMELAMQYAQQMQQTMMQGGGPESTQSKLVTNTPNANYDPLKSGGGTLNGNIKYDDILIIAGDKIIDLQMKTVLTLKQDAIGAKDLFVNTNNTRYAVYNYGTLTFSDNTSWPDLFNPKLIKVDGKVHLAYLYYSPKKNAIMQHKIPF